VGTPRVLFKRDGNAARVLMIQSRARYGHAGVFIRREIDSVRRTGVSCDVLEIAGNGGLSAYAAAALRLLWMSLFSRRYALVHAHGGEAGFVARFYLRAPLVISYQGSDLLGARDSAGRVTLAWRLRRALIRLHSHLASATITKSEELAQRLPASVRASNVVIPNGVDRDLFRPADRDTARVELGWAVEDRIVLFAANPIEPGKRFTLAHAVVERVRATVPMAHLKVANGVDPDRMPIYMNGSDCLLHPSAAEGSPNVVKEALACDLPVVATPVGDIPELVANASDSYVCAPKAAELADTLRKCIDPPRRSDGSQHIEHLDATRVAARLVAVYRSVADFKKGD
jgi:teichuronic acid biosynthesis glycosyltransferase TuaC